MQLTDLARSYYTSYALARQAMQAAMQAVARDECAVRYLRPVYDEAVARESHYADLLRRLESGEMMHIDDLRWAIEERGATLERQYIRRAQCALCGDDVVIDQYRLPDCSLVYLRGCVSCGLAYEDTL